MIDRAPLPRGGPQDRYGWAPADRAPRLRRAARILELRAHLTDHPDRARRLAREMRVRAQEIEGARVDVALSEARLLLAQTGAHDFAPL